jgi:hypothetical protein
MDGVEFGAQGLADGPAGLADGSAGLGAGDQMGADFDSAPGEDDRSISALPWPAR